MIYRKLDANGDYSFGKGRQDFHRDTDAVAQAIKTNTELLKAEWWEDADEGLPLFQSILGQPGGSTQAADLLIKDRILNTQGVGSIQSYQSAYSNRQLSIACVVTTTTGQTTTVEVNF